ncbi:MAG TPA: hypothetical protein DCG34_10550 [Clostridiales bacterium]|nr:hypothetical protein [Clostridiales bacterium]
MIGWTAAQRIVRSRDTADIKMISTKSSLSNDLYKKQHSGCCATNGSGKRSFIKTEKDWKFPETNL